MHHGGPRITSPPTEKMLQINQVFFYCHQLKYCEYAYSRVRRVFAKLLAYGDGCLSLVVTGGVQRSRCPIGRVLDQLGVQRLNLRNNAVELGVQLLVRANILVDGS